MVWPSITLDNSITVCTQEQLVKAMLAPAFYGPDVTPVEHVETHIAHLFLAGEYAYRVKKALDLGLLNSETLKARRFCCEQKLRLNRRMAPLLYLEVGPVTGTAERPVLDGAGALLEYAVKMRRFPDDALLGEVLACGELSAAQADEIARQVAVFHAAAPGAPESSGWGAPATVRDPAMENFSQLRELPNAPAEFDALDRRALPRAGAGDARAQARGVRARVPR
jgi:aminoglycoside phosphotransferase family enzyme